MNKQINIVAFVEAEVETIVNYMRNPYISCGYSNPEAEEFGRFTVKADEDNEHVMKVRATAYEAAVVIVEAYKAVAEMNDRAMERILSAKRVLMFPDLFTVNPNENKRPEDIKFVLDYGNIARASEVEPWTVEFEMFESDEEEILKIIDQCKDYFGDKFNKIFDESALRKIHQNYLDICQWELEHTDN